MTAPPPAPDPAPPPRRSVAQAALALALAVALPLIACAALAALWAAGSERARIERAAEDRGRAALAAFEREVAGQVASLRALARASALDEADLGDFFNQALGLTSIQNAHVFLRDLDGRQIFNTRVPWGTMLATVPLSDVDRWIVATARPGVSNLSASPVTGEQQVLVTIPIMRGETVGQILTASLALDHLARLLGPGDEAALTLLDPDGRVVARAAGQGAAGPAGAPAAFGRVLPGFGAVRGMSGVVDGPDLSGTPVRTAFLRSAGTGYTVAAALPRAVVGAPLRHALAALAGLGAVLAVLVLVLARRFSRAIAAAFAELAALAGSLARGEAPAPRPLAVREADAVARALAEGARQLAERDAELAEARRVLEERVEGRTRELSRQGTLLAATLDAMDQGLIVTDAEGIVAVANRRAADLLVLDPAFLAARPHYAEVRRRLVATGGLGTVPPQVADWLESGVPIPAEAAYERVRPDGTVLEVRGARLPGGGSLRTYTDVTARREAEARLAASEDRLRTLADALPQLTWVVRPGDGRAVYVNASFRTFYGPIGDAREARVACNHPDDSGRMARLWETARQTGLPLDVECRIRRHDGVYRWHKLQLQPTRVDGAVVEWIGTALDIDDIVTAREKLRETTDLLRLAQEAAGAGLWDWDMTTGLVHMSPESARMHGAPATAEGARLTSREWTALIKSEDSGSAWDAMRRAVDDRSTFSVEYRPRRDDGAAGWVLGLGRVLFDGPGRPVRIVGLHLDLTERKAAEGLLAEAKEAAERASAAKSDFLASMSHEIRTPLNGVLGYADLLLEDPALAPRHRAHVRHIQAAGTALMTVLDDVLDFSAVEADRVVLQPRPFSPRTLAEEACAIVRGLVVRKGLSLAVRVDPALPGELVGDPDRLRQVLLNLLNNAVKFTAAGRIGLALDRRDPDGIGAVCGLAVSVSDTGIGIAPDKRDRLFQRFSQVDGSIRRDFGGSGLGLAISQHLVGLMGGTIGVESEPGRGSSFAFDLTLPIASDPAEAPAPPPGPVPVDRPARVLLVEDIAINQELARAVLESSGHAVDVVGDGAEAVRAVQAADYDLVLMDVQMPGLDGLSATRAIRGLAPHPAAGVPIVAMTANVLPGQLEACLAAGMDGHVGKPFRRQQLLEAVARWAARRAA